MSLLGPILIPRKPLGKLSEILLEIISEPWLLKPNRFIKALSFSNLNTLGLGFPSCLFGVTVPTSTKP